NGPKLTENLNKLQAQWKNNPTDFQAALNLAGTYLSMGQNEQCVAVLDEILNTPKVSPEAVVAVAQYHVQAKNNAKMEELQPRLAAIMNDPAVKVETVNAIIQLYVQMQS